MILIIAAMNEELEALKSKLENPIEKNHGDILTYEGEIAGKEVVLSLSGVGKVNAAYTSTKLTDIYPIDTLINIGSAGGLKSSQKVGEIVIADECRYHDFDIGEEYKDDERFIFKPNTKLNNSAQKTIEEMGIKSHTGLLLAGDQFVTKNSDAFMNIQRKYPDAVAVDMESAAIAAVCKRANIPFIVLRSLSDVTTEEDNALSFEEYLPLASEQSAKVCYEFIKKEFT